MVWALSVKRAIWWSLQSLIKLLLRFSGFVVLGNNALDFSRVI
jgi:hypothetical protein